MTGNNRERLIVQERDRHLLRELSVIRIIDREQAKQVAGFSSTTRANVRLLSLMRAGLLRRYFIASRAGGKKALYASSEKGAQFVGVPYRGLRRPQNELLIADFSVEHQLAINELYCAVKYQPIPVIDVQFVRWLAFYGPISPAIRLIPDGYFELETSSGSRAAFLEVDLGSETLKTWVEKIHNYLQLDRSREYAERFGDKPFRVLVLAHSERRAISIRKAVAKVTQKLFWFATLTDVSRGGLFAPIWRRAAGTGHEKLFKEL